MMDSTKSATKNFFWLLLEIRPTLGDTPEYVDREVRKFVKQGYRFHSAQTECNGNISLRLSRKHTQAAQ